MNKLLIGLLLAAAGAGAYFLLRDKKLSVTTQIDQKLIVGQWTKEGVLYNFDSTGNVFRQLDSVTKDTSRYELSKHNDLLLYDWSSDPAADSNAQVFRIVQLTSDSLKIESKDSTQILFIKAR